MYNTVFVCQEGNGEGGGVGLGQRLCGCSVVERGACFTYKVNPSSPTSTLTIQVRQ